MSCPSVLGTDTRAGSYDDNIIPICVCDIVLSPPSCPLSLSVSRVPLTKLFIGASPPPPPHHQHIHASGATRRMVIITNFNWAAYQIGTWTDRSPPLQIKYIHRLQLLLYLSTVHDSVHGRTIRSRPFDVHSGTDSIVDATRKRTLKDPCTPVYVGECDWYILSMK